jgi:hypothetical protein
MDFKYGKNTMDFQNLRSLGQAEQYTSFFSERPKLKHGNLVDKIVG